MAAAEGAAPDPATNRSLTTATRSPDCELSIRPHRPSKKAPGSIARVWCITSPITLAVFVRTTELPLTWPLTEPQTRTPMPSDGSANAGFSVGEPWLPLADNAAAISVEAQKRDPNSMLALTRSLLVLRRREPALSVGEWALLPVEGEALAYTRTWQDRRFIVVLDLESRPKTVRLGAGIAGSIELSTHAGRSGELVTDAIELRADEAVVIASTGRLPG